MRQDEALFGIECSELSAARNLMRTSVIPTPVTPSVQSEGQEHFDYLQPVEVQVTNEFDEHPSSFGMSFAPEPHGLSPQIKLEPVPEQDSFDPEKPKQSSSPRVREIEMSQLQRNRKSENVTTLPPSGQTSEVGTAGLGPKSGGSFRLSFNMNPLNK